MFKSRTLVDWRLVFNSITKMSSLRNEAAHGMLANFDGKEVKVMPYGTDRLKRKEPLTIGELKIEQSVPVVDSLLGRDPVPQRQKGPTK
jgi:hypothetical protein